MLSRLLCFFAPSLLCVAAALAAEETTNKVEVNARLVEDDGAEARATGGAEALFSGWLLQAATLRYNRESGFLSAEGGITARSDTGDELRGDSMRYSPRSGNGEISRFESSIGKDNLRAAADLASLRGRKILRAENAVVTSCPVEDEDWRIVAGEFEANAEEQSVKVQNARFELGGLPIFYIPYAAYGRSDEGPLPPRGRLDNGGVEVSLPYRLRFGERLSYIPAPAWFSAEGWLWKNKMAYAGEDGDWEAEYDWTPFKDTRRSRRRFRHHLRGDDWSARLEYDRVSDFDYLRDLGSPDETSTRNLPQRAEWTRAIGGWQLAAAMERFQTLADDDSDIGKNPPHTLLPALSARHDGEHLESGADWFAEAEYAKFVRADGDQARGGRMLLDAEAGRRTNFGALSVRPALGVRAARYHSLKNSGENAPGFAAVNFQLAGEMSPAPFLPSSLSRDYRARFGYGYARHQEQGDIPVFDSAVAQRSAERIFHWNRFSGGDRAADAHFVAYGLEGRFWDSARARESLFFLIAQRVNFRDARVLLPGEKNPPDKGAENLLAEWRARPLDFLKISGDAEWNLDAGRFVRLYNNWTAEFSGNRLVRAGFLLQDERRGDEEGGDIVFLGGGAPVHPRLDMAFQANYLLDESRLSETEAAFVLRDDCDCWNLFLSVHSQIVARGNTKPTFSLGLEFSGLGKLGSAAHENLIDWLRDDG